MSNHDWDQEEVTWLESSDSVAWSGPGASGSNDITNLLDSQTVADGSQPFGNSYSWNITSAAQDSMRDAERLDLMIECAARSNQCQCTVLFPNDYERQRSTDSRDYFQSLVKSKATATISIVTG